jgi:hypothetical protein
MKAGFGFLLEAVFLVAVFLLAAFLVAAFFVAAFFVAAFFVAAFLVAFFAMVPPSFSGFAGVPALPGLFLSTTASVATSPHLSKKKCGPLCIFLLRETKSGSAQRENLALSEGKRTFSEGNSAFPEGKPLFCSVKTMALPSENCLKQRFSRGRSVKKMSRSFPDSCRRSGNRREGMGQFESFARVLEQTIEKRLRREWEQSREQQAPPSSSRVAPDYLASLLGSVERFQQDVTGKAALYHRHRRPPPPRPPHALSETQRKALLFFQNFEGLSLADNYSHRELQRAYHELALRLHPDRPRGSQALFIELKAAYDDLRLVFKR